MINVYPTQIIGSMWHGDADVLVSAMSRNCGECTGDQLKMLLMRGELILVGSDDLYAAIQHIQHPNKRVLHIYAAASRDGGRGLNDGDIAELCGYARQTGCEAVTCSADKAASRLYQRFGFEPLYTTMEIKL
jgi:hypothetical protein